MSQFNHLNSYSLQAHNWFFPVGAAIDGGVVSKTNWPESTEPTMDDRFVGHTEEWMWKKNLENEEVLMPVGGILVRKQIVDFFQSLDSEMTVNSVSRIAMQILFGSALELTEDVGAFVPLASYRPEGLWICQKYTNEDEKVFVANIWCKVDVKEIGGGNKKVLKPKFEIKLLDADDNYMFFGKPELLDV